MTKYFRNHVLHFTFGLLFISLSSLQLACTRSNSSSSTPSDVQNQLVMGLSADYPPFEFKKAGEVVGFDVDVAQAVAQDLGKSLVIQDMEFSGLIPALQTGRVDFVMSGMTVTEERKKNIDFSDMYFQASFSVIVDQSSSLKTEADFKDKKIGAQLGSTMEKFAKEKAKLYSGMQVVSLGKNPHLIQELKSGRIDGVLSEDVQAVAFVEANPSLKQVRLGSNGDGYAVAFARGNDKSQKLKDQFNASLAKLKTSGKLEQIKQKWLGK